MTEYGFLYESLKFGKVLEFPGIFECVSEHSGLLALQKEVECLG